MEQINAPIFESSPVAVTSPSDFATASSKEFLDISGKQSDLGHFLEVQGKVVPPFLCTLFFTYFDI